MKKISTQFTRFAVAALIFFGLFTLIAVKQNRPVAEAVKKCLIVSDIHLDPMFNAHNDTALRTRLMTTPVSGWQKLFENTPAESDISVALLGKDANYAILQSALKNMKERLAAPAFIIIAGDFIWHNATPADSVLKRKTIQFIARLFKDRFPDTEIIPAMGNNDTYGQDYALQDPKFLHDFAEAWEPNLHKASADELKKQGYYTARAGNLKIVVYNSALLNYGTNYPQAIPMLNWIQQNLADPQSKNIWLVDHILPGLNGYSGGNNWNPAYNQTFVNTVVKYAPKVKLAISGHTHFNDFKVFYDVNNKPVAFMRVVPSVCSNHGNNPSFEVAEFNAEDARIIHETNWYLNLAGIPATKPVKNAVWTSVLNLPQSLHLEKDNAAGFAKLIGEIRSDKSYGTLHEYVNFYNVGTKMDSTNTINANNYNNYLKADSLKASN